MNSHLAPRQLILRIFLAAYGLYFLCFYLGPWSYPFNSYVLVLLLLFILGLLGGDFFLRILPVRKVVRTSNASNNLDFKSNNIYFNHLIFYTAISVILPIVDFVILGDVWTLGIVENREQLYLQGRRGSLIGMFNILFGGMPILLASFLIIDSRRTLSNNRTRLGWIFALTGILAYALSGGRNGIFISLVILAIIKYLSRKKQPELKRKSIRPILYSIALVLMVFGFFIAIFIERSKVTGVGITIALYNIVDDFGVDIAIRDFGSDFLNTLYGSVSLLLFYLNHSLSVLSGYFDTAFDEMTYGVLTFPLFYMFLDTFFGTSFYVDATDKLILNGVYLSMLGYLYIDFGEIGLFLVACILGFATSYFLKRSFSGDHRAVQYKVLTTLAALLLSCIALSPIYNILAGHGLPVVFAVVIMATSVKISNILFRRSKSYVQ